MVPFTLIYWSWEDAFDPAAEKGWSGLDLVVAFLESIGCSKRLCKAALRSLLSSVPISFMRASSFLNSGVKSPFFFSR